METLLQAMAIVARTGSIPLRESSSGRPPFWWKAITATKTRPIAAGTTWLDYIILRGGFEFFPKGYSATVNRFIATSKTDPATSLLQYRFLINGDIVPTQEFDLTAGIDFNVDRTATNLAPWPAMVRRCSFEIPTDNVLTLQVQNLGVATEIAIAGLFGWYYPSLGHPGREAFESTGMKQDDSVRNPAGGM